MRTKSLIAGASRLEVSIHGHPDDRPCVLLLPSLGRSVRDFDDLAGRLHARGFSVLAPEPRGIAGSTGPLDSITLHDLAGDAALVATECASGPVDVIGHAFGNRVARCLATRHPDRVHRLCLLGAGGLAPPEEAAKKAFGSFFNDSLDEPGRRAAMRTANFSPGSDPAPWMTGWWPDTGRRQAAAAAATPLEEWWTAGRAPILVVQGLDDRMAPPANGRALRDALGERVCLSEIAGAGHALLPEKPRQVAAAVLAYLTGAG